MKPASSVTTRYLRLPHGDGRAFNTVRRHPCRKLFSYMMQPPNYGADSAEPGTEEGPLHFREFMNSPQARRPHYLVVGHPIGHSLSPFMHRIALKTHGLEAGYYAVDLDPDDKDLFAGWLSRKEFRGANLTIPYKKDFLAVVDRLDPLARRAGAINTLVKEEGGVTGYNTDIDGFQRPLEEFRSRLERQTAIVFGTGGASLAVRLALSRLGMSRIVMVSRNPERPGEMESGSEEGPGINTQIIYCRYEEWPRYADEALLLVNTTPLGMTPDTGTSPVSDSQISLLRGKICYDLIYNPLRTRFLQQAEEMGAQTIGGLHMFVGQGARAFELWTGKNFPTKEVAASLIRKLSRAADPTDSDYWF